MKRYALSLMMMVLLLLCGRVQAQTCTAVTASPVSFGSVSPISGSAVSVTGVVNVSCSWNTVAAVATPNVQVCLNIDSGDASSSLNPRSLANGTNLMQYNLYQDSGHSLVWGSTLSGTTPLSVVLTTPLLGGTTNKAVNFFGLIASNQPTVPSVGNANTLYVENFTGTHTSLNYLFFLILTSPPACSTITVASGTFGFSVNATVINNCNISAGTLSFGSLGVLKNTVNAVSTISAQCTSGDAYQISLSGGSSSNVAARSMQGPGGAKVTYQLYVDAGHMTPWGDGTSGTGMMQGTGNGTMQNITVYGTLPAQTTPAPGSYSDTITATISF